MFLFFIASTITREKEVHNELSGVPCRCFVSVLLPHHQVQTPWHDLLTGIHSYKKP
ncbi:hypothetical protein Hdeb2414_s0054g00754651 [Helianthus debilis subsp. tardiflorus]